MNIYLIIGNKNAKLYAKNLYNASLIMHKLVNGASENYKDDYMIVSHNCSVFINHITDDLASDIIKGTYMFALTTIYGVKQMYLYINENDFFKYQHVILYIIKNYSSTKILHNTRLNMNILLNPQQVETINI